MVFDSRRPPEEDIDGRYIYDTYARGCAALLICIDHGLTDEVVTGDFKLDLENLARDAQRAHGINYRDVMREYTALQEQRRERVKLDKAVRHGRVKS